MPLDYDNDSIAMRNCRRVRIMYPVPLLQVRPDPRHPDNVQLRIGQGAWTTLHVIDAIAFTRLARRNLHKQRKRGQSLPKQE